MSPLRVLKAAPARPRSPPSSTRVRPGRSASPKPTRPWCASGCAAASWSRSTAASAPDRSEEHTSELQSRPHLVCRLLLEKKKKKIKMITLLKKKKKKKKKKQNKLTN